MSNESHLLQETVRAAAQAVWNTRRAGHGLAEEDIDGILPATFDALVAETNAALAAAGAVGPAPTPRPRGPLRPEDAAALGLDMGVHAVAILTVDARAQMGGAGWRRDGATPFSSRAIGLLDELAREVASEHARSRLPVPTLTEPSDG